MRKKQEINSNIGLRIKEARERAGFTQDKLAELTDVGVPYLAKLETGNVGISLQNFIVFCSVLGVSADYIIWGEREENSTITVAERIRHIPERQYKLLEQIINSYLEAIQLTEIGKTALVSIMHVNSETGIIQPVQEIGDFLKDKDVYFHIDATQSFGKMNAIIRSIPYDMLSLSAHKIGGPQGIGALILRRKKGLRDNFMPLILGGGQEFGFRSGTLPVPLIGGFGKAAGLCEQ